MQNGSIKLFRLFGIDVFLHWSWFLVAAFLIPDFGASLFSGPDAMLWSSLLYVSLFAVVVMHEYGHALACVSVGGKVKHIVLWPLGGIAFVQPPQRPGAVLWSIVAGPLVNVLLVPVTVGAHVLVSGSLMLPEQSTNIQEFFFSLMLMNAGLLVFNMLPIPPLDGGRVMAGLLPHQAAWRYARLEPYGLFVVVGVLFLLPMLLRPLGIGFNPAYPLIILPSQWLVDGIFAVLGLGG